MTSSPVDLEQFGYEIVRVIGHGRFGSVLQLRKANELSNMCVCKVLILEGLGETDRRLAEQESYVLRSLHHENIVKFQDCFRLSSGCGLALLMEYCDAGDLRHAIRMQLKESQRFSEKQIMTWFHQILEGLEYLHSHRIIHRDLKTSNIFLKGPPPHQCLIGDFGISRVLEETVSSAQTVIGTPYYLSPEVCKREPYTTKSDMWSLGAVLYELAMLKIAFDGNNLLSLVSHIIHEAYEPFDQSVYSEELASLVSRLLCKSPDDRPAAAALLNEPFVASFREIPDARNEQNKSLVETRKRRSLRSRAGIRMREVTAVQDAPFNLEPVDERELGEVPRLLPNSLVVQSRPCCDEVPPPPPPRFYTS
jgi:NIMA (never in mitosis gene a)-related kinase